MMQDIERGLDTSSSVSRHPVITKEQTLEQTVSERTQSSAGSFAQKVKQKLLGVLQDLRKGFRRPKLFKEAPNLKQSIRAVFYRSREFLAAGCLSSVI